MPAFFVQPPAKDPSWTNGQYAPTLPYTGALVCPINWAYIKARASYLTDVHIQAYEFRQPWNPDKQNLEYDAIVQRFHANGDIAINSLEGARKRFGKANLAVFEVTGVYFENSTPGLKDHGIKGRTADEKEQAQARQNAPAAAAPNASTSAGNVGADADDDDDDDEEETDDDDNEDGGDEDDEEDDDPKNPLPVKERLRLGAKLITFVLQPPKEDKKDRCEQCCVTEDCYEIKCREAWRDFHRGLDLDAEEDYDGPFWAGDHSHRRYAKFLSEKKCAPFGCPAHQPLTMGFVDSEKFADVCESGIEWSYLVNVSRKAFDLFTSCFAPEFLGEFPDSPKRLDVFLNKEGADDNEDFTEAIYEDIEEYTTDDILEAYLCSQSLNCPVVSDVLLGKLRSIVQDREFSLEKFSPRALRYVFSCTNASDPIRLFLFDAFRLDMAEGHKAMQQNRDRYPEQLVHYWDYWKLRRREVKSPKAAQRIVEFNAAGWQGGRGPRNGVLGIISLLLPSDKHPDGQKGIIWGNCKFRGYSSRIGKPQSEWLSPEALHERFTQIESIDALRSDSCTLFWETYRNRKDID